MELLILLLLSPVALTYAKSSDPNDEPFLPIYPVYPYNPKLIKRGTERDGSTQLTPELYTPKAEGARETYTANLGANYPRDPYYPTYNPYPKPTATTSSTSYSPQYYGSAAYSYPSTPYNAYNSYSATPYTSAAYPSTPYSSTQYPATVYASSQYPSTQYSSSQYPNTQFSSSQYPTTPYPMTQGYTTMPYPSASGSYPSYYYQAPYYYPNYYPHSMFAPPPPGGGYDYSNYKDAYPDAENDGKGSEKKTSEQKSKDDSSQESAANAQFVDGGNYISGNSKDLDSQPSTQKAAGSYNQLEQVSDLPLKGLPIPLPKTTYRVISVAGQPVGPDYPLPASYARAQQLEHLMSQTIAKLLAQNTALQQQQSRHLQQQQQQQQQEQQQDSQYTNYDVHQNSLPANNNNGGSYINAHTYKDTQQYVPIPNVLAKTGLAYVFNPNLLGKLTAGQATRQTAQPPTTLTTLTKSTDYVQQPLYDGTQSDTQDPQKEEASDQQDDYDTYSNGASTVTDAYEKQNQNYQSQAPNYVTVRTPQSYSYQYANYNPGQGRSRKPAQRYKSNLEDVSFGSKHANKG